jgi:hypothetical protein
MLDRKTPQIIPEAPIKDSIKKCKNSIQEKNASSLKRYLWHRGYVEKVLLYHLAKLLIHIHVK